MHEIEVITDSTCDLPQEFVDQYEIKVIPHYVIWGDKQYLDRVDIQPEEFYEMLQTEKTYPSSAQATVQDYLTRYQEAVINGAREIIVLTISSAMSGAYHMAQEAAKLVNIPVHVVDAKGPSMTLGWQVLQAVRLRELGVSVTSILAGIESVKNRLVQIVGMDSLSFLQKGGRIGDAASWLGAKLQIKPVVAINHETGRVEPAGVARTHSAVMDMIYQKFFEKAGSGTKLHIAVLHGNALEDAKKLADKIALEYKNLELIINITGPVLGINTGPRALALCGYFD